MPPWYNSAVNLKWRVGHDEKPGRLLEKDFKTEAITKGLGRVSHRIRFNYNQKASQIVVSRHVMTQAAVQRYGSQKGIIAKYEIPARVIEKGHIMVA